MNSIHLQGAVYKGTRPFEFSLHIGDLIVECILGNFEVWKDLEDGAEYTGYGKFEDFAGIATPYFSYLYKASKPV